MSSIDVDNYSKEMQGNTRRAAEINRYYDLKYAEYKSIAFEIMLGLVLLIILNLLLPLHRLSYSSTKLTSIEW